MDACKKKKIQPGFTELIQTLADSFSVPVRMYAPHDENNSADICGPFCSDAAEQKIAEAAAENDPLALYVFHGGTDELYALAADPEQEKQYMLIGPWRLGEADETKHVQITERFGEGVWQWYRTLPSPSPAAFQKSIMGLLRLYRPDDEFTVKEVFLEVPGVSDTESPDDNSVWQEFTESYLEERYKAEDELMRTIAGGDEATAQQALAAFKEFDFGGRFTGSPEEYRHGLIIMNTLYRKALEQAEVHPYHIDRISHMMADKIHTVNTDEQKRQLETEMVREYTRYVREYSLHGFSDPVKQTIRYINRNLEKDLSLPHLSNEAHVSQSYLSSRFSRETGMTITNYITQQRVYKAVRLLQETDGSIAAIAETVGILDENYFTKMFRKVIGVTPSRYRSRIRGKGQ